MNFFKKINIFIIVVVYIFITAFFIFGKRTDFSIEERRNVKKLFDFNDGKNIQSQFEKNFIDSIPERDNIINLSILLKSFKGIRDKNGISIINTSDKKGYNEENEGLIPTRGNENKKNENINTGDAFQLTAKAEKVEKNNISTKSEVDKKNKNITQNINKLEDEIFDVIDVKNSNNKVLVIGENEKVRGLNIYEGKNESYLNEIADNLDVFAKNLEDKYNLYFMVVPAAAAYYMPKQLKNFWVDQKKEINDLYDKLDKYKCVDIYDNLEKHKNENIYLRTDSHWSQLGAYYAGEEFANVAKVEYPSIDNYNKNELENYCSSFYRYTEDQRFIDNPEVFVYYEPKIEYKVKQIFYKNDAKDGEDYIDKIYEDFKFFKPESYSPQYYYLLYMGGDENTTIVKMPNNKTKRKLVLIKDSYGNAFAPNLFFSFDEVHIIDYRFFRGNLKEYLEENEITDILLLSQIASTYTESKKYNILLEQDKTKSENGKN